MKRLFGAGLLLLAIGGASANAQVPALASPYSGVGSIYGAPGYYGMSYGVASYGVPRTFSGFSSPYGEGFAYGHASPAILPGRHGAGLWSSSPSAVHAVYGNTGSYRTFPARTWPYPSGFGPPVGAYAPGLGPVPLQVR
jgi:hypothetical protein